VSPLIGMFLLLLLVVTLLGFFNLHRGFLRLCIVVWAALSLLLLALLVTKGCVALLVMLFTIRIVVLLGIILLLNLFHKFVGVLKCVQGQEVQLLIDALVQTVSILED